MAEDIPGAVSASVSEVIPAVRARLPLGRIYFVLVTIAGLLLAAWILGRHGHLSFVSQPTFWAMAAVGVVTELIGIPLPKGGRLTASFAVVFATLLLMGLPATVGLIAVMVTVSGGIIQRRMIRLNLFNLAQYTLSYGAASGILHLCGIRAPSPPTGREFPYLLLATAGYQIVNVALVNGVIALSKRIAPWKVLWEDDRWEVVFTFVLAPLAVLLVVVHHAYGWWGAVTALVPLIFSASVLVLYLQVKRSQDELGIAHRELSILHQVAQKIGSQIHLDTTLSLIAQEVGRVVPYDECLIFLTQQEGEHGDLKLVRQRIDDENRCARPIEIPMGQGVIGSAAASNQSVLIDDLSTIEQEQVPFLEAYRSLLVVPILSDDKVLGVISLLATRSGAFTPSDQRLLTILASQAAVAIKNAQLYQATQQLAITDGLTGVYNRRYFQRQLDNELRRAPRLGFPIALILLDVDHFKKFNDSHGHLLGDQVLRSVAQILKESVRETDVVARYGGEEFAVILPETNADQALEVAERIRYRMRIHTFWGRGQTPVPVTLSMGIASNPEANMPADALIELADQCLYQAKSNGRDRIVCATSQANSPVRVSESGAGAEIAQAKGAQGPRQPARKARALDPEAWRNELETRFNGSFAELWAKVSERLLLAPEDEGRWRSLAEGLLGTVCEDLAQSEGDPRPASPAFLAPHAIREAVEALIQRGLTLTQSEDLVLAVTGMVEQAIGAAPFSPQERLMVLGLAERLSHQLQLAVSEVWHGFFQQTSQHLLQLSRLDQRLAILEGMPRVAQEACTFACSALPADVAIVFMRAEGGGGHLRVLASAGLVPSTEGVQWLVPLRHGWPSDLLDAGSDGLAMPLGQEDPPFSRLVGDGLRSAYALPMHATGGHLEAMGALVLFSAEPARFSSLQAIPGSYQRLARGIANRLIHALSRERAEEAQQDRYLEALLALAETQDGKESGGTSHSDAVLAHALALADGLALPDDQRELLRQAVLLHDLGKVGVPDAILLKPGRLTAQELAIMRSHPLVGARLLGPVESLRGVIPAIRHHHEHWNGSGYPDGLKGEEIPLLARILAVADAFDGMTTDKPYRPAMDAAAALAELERCGHFDPQLVELLAYRIARARA